MHSLHRLTLAVPGTPLFAALAAAVPGLSRHQARRAVEAGLATIDGRKVNEPQRVLPERCLVELDLRQGVRAAWVKKKHGVPDGRQPFTILHRDHSLVVVDKAAGVLSAPTHRAGLENRAERGHVPELLRRALRRKGEAAGFIGLVHRLDQATSGCLVFALARQAQRILSEQFAHHSAHRVYRALVMGQPRQDADSIEARLGRGQDGRRAVVDDDEAGKESLTRFRVLRRFAHGSELEIDLETGRTHQIRVALASIGCPVWGDTVYARRKPRPGQPRAPRLMLHAERISLDHPADGRRLEVRAPLPEDWKAFAALLAEAPAAGP